MKETEYSFYDEPYSDGCPGCYRIEPQPIGLDIVYEDDNFRVHQDYVLPIPGMMVIETKRHIRKVTDFSDEEKGSLFNVVTHVREAMESVGIDQTIIVQEEKSSHFHLWILPMYPWMIEATDGKLRNLQDIFNFAKENMKTNEAIEEVERATERIKNYIEKVTI